MQQYTYSKHLSDQTRASSRTCSPAVVLVLLLIASLQSTSIAAIYFVNPNPDRGNDQWPGTQSQPWSTLGKAQATVASGDTVRLYGGNYGDYGHVNPSYADWVTYEAVEGETPIWTSADINRNATVDNVYLRFRGITFQHGGVSVTRSRYVEILDCTFIGPGYDVNEVPIASTTNVAVYMQIGTSHVKIDNCVITGNGPGWLGTTSTGGQDGANFGRGYHWGIFAKAGCTSPIQVSRCTVESCDYGISLVGGGLNVTGNTVRYISGDGIKFMTSGDTINVTDNRIYALGRFSEMHVDAIQFHGTYGSDWQDYTNVTIARNRLHTSDYQGLFARVGGGSANWLVENNLVYDIPHGGSGAYPVRFFSIDPLVLRNNTVMGITTFHSERDTCRVTLYGNILDWPDFYTTESVVIEDEDYNVIGGWGYHMGGYTPGAHTRILGRTALLDEFIDYGSWNFVPDPNGNCADVIPLGLAATLDINGNVRIDIEDAGNDGTNYANAGCYEYGLPGNDNETELDPINPSGNRPPVLSAIGAKSTRENERLAFSITATDPDGDTITYSATNLPSGAAFSGRSFSWTPSYSQAGSYQVTFIASDGQAQDSETVTISVANVNRPPVLSSIGDRSVDENSSLTFNLSATDPDGDTLAYSASGLPAGAGFSGRTFTWTPASNQVGVYDITFTVSDGRLQDTETITLAVLTRGADATAPTVTRISPQPGAIQVSLNHLVKLQINDAGQGVDAESVVIRVDDHVIYQGNTNQYTSEYGQCSRTGSRFSYRYAFQPNESFECDRSVNVKVAASDLAGNAMSTYSYSFLTEMRAFGSNYLASDADAGKGPKGRSATVSDSAGDIWAVWHAGPAGNREIYVATFMAGAEAFGAPVRLTTDAVDQCNPDIALAPDGRLYVVWQDRTRGNWDICLSTSTDGSTWSRPARITDADGDETNPVVIIDRQSPPRAYVAWQDNRNGNNDIYVAVSTSVFSESTVTRVTTNSAHQIDPDIAVDGQNTVTVVWTDMRNANADIYGASSSGNWTNVPIVTGSGAQTSPAVAAAPDSSVLHLLWTDDRPGNRDIYYASSNGLPASALSGSSIIDDSSSAHQFAPTITCVDSSRVFACWEDLRYGDSDLFMADLGSGAARTNIFVGDDRTNSSQGEPAVGIDGYGNPYVVWTDSRGTQNEIYYAATTFINPVPLDSKQVVAAVGATIGADPANIRSKTDVSIVVPAGACQYDARITIAEILNPQALPVECLGSYDFGPSGIDFDAPVTITIPYQLAGTSSSAKPYWYDSLTGALSQQGITDIENLVISPTLNALRFKTTHFTPFYLVAGDADVSSITTDADVAAGCSVSATGSGSVRDILVPYGIVAVVMLALKRADRRRQRRFGGSTT